MQPGSVLAIYALIWVMCFFVSLPFGVRTDEEMGVRSQRGHADSAPHAFSFGKVALRTTILATVLMTLFYLNYVYGWIDVASLDWTRR